MAYEGGTITRKEIIEDQALQVGSDYADNIEVAIDANKKLTDSSIQNFKKITREVKKLETAMKLVKLPSDLNKLNKQTVNVLTDSHRVQTQIVKLQKEGVELEKKKIEAEKSLERLKQDRIKTEKEIARLQQDKERLSKLQYQTDQNNLKEIERLKQLVAKTEREVIKLKEYKIRLEKMETDQVKRKTTLTMEDRVQQQLANKAEKEAVLEKMGLIGAYQKLNKQRTESKKRLQDLIATGNASNKQIRQAQREFDLLDKKVRQADNATKDFTKNVGNYKSAFSGLSNLMGAFGVIGGITGAVALGKSMYETTKQIQAQEIALRMLSETEETYIKNKDFLIRISEQYGLELLTTTNAYKNYFASAKTSIEEGKISFNEMQMIFEKVSKSASMLGLSVEQQEGAFLAISQMMSKGTVQSEELRGQLGERLPGAFEVMAQALGVTTMELGDMLKKGEVLAADVLPKFAIAYEKAIGADQIERTETLAAAQNRASNKWTDFVENLNSGKGTITQVGLGFFGMTSNILDLIGAKEQLSKTIQNEQLDLNMLIGKITSTNISNNERLSLIEKLKVNYPDFISFIQDEDYSNQSLISTLKQVNDNYRDRIALQIQVEKENELLKERDKVARMSIVAENNLYEQLHALNAKYNLGLHITRDNLQKSANQLQQVGKKNLSVWETGVIEYYQHTLGRLVPTLDSVNKRYDDLIAKNKTIQFSALEKIPESRRQHLEDKWEKEQAEKKAAEVRKSNQTASEESEKEKKKREAAERKAMKEAEKRAKERLSGLKEAYESEKDLAIFRAESKAEILKAESVNEKNSQDERLEALLSYFELEEESLRLNIEKQLTLSRAFQEDKKAFTEKEISDMLNNISVKSDITNQELLILEKYYSDQEKLRKQNQKGLEDQAKKEAEIIAKQTAGVLLGVDKDKFDEVKALEESYQKKEITTEEYEKRLNDISLKYTTKTFEEQIKGLKDLIDLTGYSEEEKLKIKTQIAEAEMNLIKAKNDYERDQTQKSLEVYQKKLEIVRKSVADFSNLFAETFNIDSQIVEGFIMNLLDKTATIEEKIKSTVAFIGEITNALYQQRIEEIDSEIERTNEKYEKEISNATGNEKLQERIRIKQQADVEKLEAKKKKEQQKQANANKAFAIAQTVWATAQAIMQAYAQLGPIGGTIAAVLVGTLGAIQINQIRNQEIPKYEFGTRGKKHKGGPAELAEKRPEVVIEPGKDPYIVSKRSIMDLPKGTEVIPSVSEYERLQKSSVMMSLVSEKQELDSYQANMMFDSLYGAEIVDELKQLRKQKQNIIVNNSTNVEIGHEIWKLNNTRWKN